MAEFWEKDAAVTPAASAESFWEKDSVVEQPKPQEEFWAKDLKAQENAEPKEEPKGVIAGAVGSIKKGINNLIQVPSQIAAANLEELVEAHKEKYGPNLENAPADKLPAMQQAIKALDAYKAEFAEAKYQNKKLEKEYGVNPLELKFRVLSEKPEYKDAGFMDKTAQWASQFADASPSEIGKYILSLGIESAPQSTAMAVSAIFMSKLTGSKTAGLVTAGSTSAAMEFGSNYIELREQGFSPQEAWEKASIKAGVVGLLDAASMGSASKAAEIVINGLKTNAYKKTAKEISGQILTQSALGAGGEGLGSYASGQPVDPIAMGAEALGEVFGAPIEAAGTYRANTAKPQGTTAPPAPPKTAAEQVLETEQGTAPPAPPENIAPVTSAAGTPIPVMPLNNVQQEQGTPAPAVEDSPEVKQRAVEYEMRQGITPEMALIRARSELADTGAISEPQTARVDTGTSEPSVSLPSDGETSTGQLEAPSTEGLASPVGSIGEFDAGTGLQPDTLTTEQVEVKTKVEEAKVKLETAVATQQTATTQTSKVEAQKEVNKASQELRKVTAEEKVVDKIAEKEAPKVTAPKKSNVVYTSGNGSTIERKENYNGNTTARVEYTVKDADGKHVRDTSTKKEAMEWVGIADTPVTKTQPTFPAQTAETSITPETNEAAPPSVEPITPEATETAPIETAPPIEQTKSNRGRKAGTPEQQAASAETRKVSGAESTRVRRKAEKAAAVMESTVSDADIAKQGLTKAQDNLAAAKALALEDLVYAANNPAHRNNTAGKAAKLAIDKGKAAGTITNVNELDAKKRIAEKLKNNEPIGTQKKTSEAKKSIDTTSVADPAYLKFTNVTQAFKRVVETGTAFERILARRLMPLLSKNTRLIIADSLMDLPNITYPNGTTLRGSFEDALGMYSSGEVVNGVRQKYIILRSPSFGNGSSQGINNRVFLHEALHAVTADLISKFQKLGKDAPEAIQKLGRSLQDVMQAARDRYDIAIEYGEDVSQLDKLFKSTDENGLDILNDMDEFVAYGLTSKSVMEFLLDTEGGITRSKFKQFFDRFVNRLRGALGMDASHTSALSDLIALTEAVIKEQLKVTPEAAQKANAASVSSAEAREKIAKGESKRSLSSGFQQLKDVRSFGDVKDMFNDRYTDMGEGFIQKLLATMQTADILRWMGDKIPGIKAIDQTVQAMANVRTNMLAASAKYAKFFDKFFKQKGSRAAMANVQVLARLHEVSPTSHTDAATAIAADTKIAELKKNKANPATIADREQAIRDVFDAYDALDSLKDGKKVYGMMREFYLDNRNLERALLDANIAKFGLDPAQQNKLMATIRSMYELSEGIKEYSPFMRFGENWASIQEKGKPREYYMFEDGAARNRFLRERARAMGKTADELHQDGIFDSGNNLSEARKSMGTESAFLKEMFAAVDDATNKSTFDKEELKDQLYQTYLSTLPERSYRKNFIHAENVTGFELDPFRVFKTAATRFAGHAARLAHSTDLESQISGAYQNLQGAGEDKRKMRLFIDEVAKRARGEINPQEQGQWANRLNKIAYLWLLTSAASAATQMVSVPVMVMPTLNQQYGYGKSAASFFKYANFMKSMGTNATDAAGNPTHTAPSIGSSAMVRNSPILQRAFKEALARGVTTDTNTSVLTNLKETPDNAFAASPTRALSIVGNGMAALFNGAERMSREMTYMMTFELEYNKSKDFDKAVEAAVANTQELLGRYDNFNRPRILQNFLGKTVGQFKMYAVNMTSFFIRNAYNMFKWSDPKTALAATERMAGTLLMGGMFHGLFGMPLFSVVSSAVASIMDGLESDEEKRRRRAKNPLVQNDPKARFKDSLEKNFGDFKVSGLDGRQHGLNELLERGPISALTDMNIGSRTSFNDMWWRDSKPGKTNMESIQNMIAANLGPSVSVGANMVSATDDFHNGHVQRGLEKLVPALFKNPLMAMRYAQEGIKTPKGLAVMKKDELTTGNLIGQAIGFAPTSAARIQDTRAGLTEQIVMATNSRTDVLRQIDDAILGGNGKDIQHAFKQMKEHNSVYPMEKFIIKPATVIDSVQNAAKNKGMSFRGMQMDKKLAPYLYPALKASSPLK